MKFDIIITLLVVSYAAAISIPETAHVADFEARHIGELCTAPIVYSPYVIPIFIFLSVSERKKEQKRELFMLISP
jgi:hypothetical protein